MRRMFCVVNLILFATACDKPPAVQTTAARVVPSTAPSVKTARLIVRVTDLRNKNGKLIFGVFDKADGFPSTQANAVNWQVKPASGDGVFTADLPPGNFGLSVLHDENNNGGMDKNFLGIPTEGYGVANNPKPRRRAATFQEATISLPASGADVSISVQYDFI